MTWHLEGNKIHSMTRRKYQSVKAARVTIVGALSRFPVEATSGNRLSSILPIKCQKTSRSLLCQWAFTNLHNKCHNFAISQRLSYKAEHLSSPLYGYWLRQSSKRDACALLCALRTFLGCTTVAVFCYTKIPSHVNSNINGKHPLRTFVLQFQLPSNYSYRSIYKSVSFGISIFNFDYCCCWLWAKSSRNNVSIILDILKNWMCFSSSSNVVALRFTVCQTTMFHF